MKRRPLLSGSWYPDSKNEIEGMINRWLTGEERSPEGCAAIVPHAGWYFSGKTAARTLGAVLRDQELMVVVGGHLPAGSSIIAAYENEIETPAGILRNRTDLLGMLGRRVSISEDIFDDNTVEIVMPMIKVLFPETDILWVRTPADKSAIVLADAIYETAAEAGVKTAVIGSTDLTHYGLNYRYYPEGTGSSAVEWAKKENDAEIIELFRTFMHEEGLKHAEKKRSACSAGAAVCAARFAELNGRVEGRLVEYSNSYDIRPSDSFVGYAGIIF